MLKKRTVVAATATIFTVWMFVFVLNQDSRQKLNKKEFFAEQNKVDLDEHALNIDNQPDGTQQNLPRQQKVEGQGQRSSRDILDRMPSKAPTEDIFLSDNMWIPAGWSGLPLSIDNPAYFDQSDPDVLMYKSEMVKTMKSINIMEWARADSDPQWEAILEKYETLIGWNGIFDAVEQAQTELGIDVARRLHVIGEVLARSPMITKNRYVIEITSRDMLHKAPMHGGVWIITKNLLDNYAVSGKFSELFETIDEELCFFKNEDDMGNIWISCMYFSLFALKIVHINVNIILLCKGVHGVGHGIAKYYGVDQIAVGLDICAQHPDQQYQFACATGIFMELEIEYPEKTFSPCDSNRFAAACFRFKNRLTSHIFYDTKDPCSTQPTPYHRRACIWGFAYIKENAKPREAYSVCEPYRPQNATEQPAANDYAACFDGFLGSHEIVGLSERMRNNFCDNLMPYEKAHSICEYYRQNTLLRFTFDKGEEEEAGEEVFFYNYELLEELFDPSVIGKSAAWLPEWNRIVPHYNFPKITTTHAHQ